MVQMLSGTSPLDAIVGDWLSEVSYNVVSATLL